MASASARELKSTPAIAVAFSPRARKRQRRIVALWFTAIGLTFVGLIAAFGTARAAAASSPITSPPARPITKVIPGPIRVARDPLLCTVSASTEPGALAVTINNSSTQVIEKKQTVIYQMTTAATAALHGVRAPVLIPVGGQFSVLVQQQGDLAAGACKAWVFVPLQAVQTAVQ